MKVLSASILLVLMLKAFTINDPITIDKKEAQKAFTVLMDIRNDPKKYQEELELDDDTDPSSVQLSWNDTLADVAETKAYDMASRNYFAHTDPDGYGINYSIADAGYELEPSWTAEKSDNNFESLSANDATGEKAIKKLVRDHRTPLLGHRKHLLGLDTWNSNLTDIGIGFVRSKSGSKYKTYICVIIAKHTW